MVSAVLMDSVRWRRTSRRPQRSGSSVSYLLLSGDLVERQGIKVLSYPQYCRFRSLQRRIQAGARGPVLQDLHLLALGGVKARPNTRLLFCRDTFNHPTLESAGFSCQFSECFE